MAADSNSFPRNTIEQAFMVKKGWEALYKEMKVPNLTLEEFKNEIKQALDKIEQAEKLKELKSKAILERNKALTRVWNLTKRIRNAAKATFGDNSIQLEKFGLKLNSTRGTSKK